MTHSRTLVLAAIFAAGLSGTAMAGGAYDRLPPGEKKIADALYASQSGPVVMSRNQIAAARRGSGWGQVFHTMRAEGLTDAKSLGQVVSSSHHSHVTGGIGSHSYGFGHGRGH
jgi:hypothetical protein